jgi:ABC-2 type transport system permease protein
MSASLTIAKRDFLSYYHSLKGSIIFWFFLFLIGIFFYYFVYAYIQYEQQAAQMGGDAPRLSFFLTAFFQNLNIIFLLVIPAVTMGSFAEERKHHTERLLMSSPVKVFDIVLGKFIASTGVLSLVLMASAVYPIFLVFYGDADIGTILSSYLGVFLLLCAQVSLGLWVSSTTDNQFVAFVFTMLCLFLLLILDSIVASLSNTGWVEHLLRYLATSGHFQNFLQGLISVKNLTYFVIFTFSFLFFTHLTVDSRRWR